MDNCPLDSCPQNISPQAIAFPPRTIAPRIIPSGQFPPRIIVLRKIAPQTILTYENCPRINTPGQFPPRIIDLRGRWTLDKSHLGLFRVIVPRLLCRLEFFYCLLFRLYIKITLKNAETCNMCHNKIFYKHKHVFFQNIWQAPFRVIIEIIELLSKVWNVFIALLILAN